MENMQEEFINNTNEENISFHMKDIADKLRHHLYNNWGDVGMNIMACYHFLEKDKIEALQRSGKIVYSVLKKIGELYRYALLNKDLYFLGIVETGVLKTRVVRNFHRALFLEKRRILPLIFRGDSPNGVQFIEFHDGLRGLGYMTFFRKEMENVLGRSSFFSFRRLQDFLLNFIEYLCPKQLALYACEKESLGDKDMDYLCSILFGRPLKKIKPYLSIMGARKKLIMNPNCERLTLLAANSRRMYSGKLGRLSFLWNKLLQKIIFNSRYDIIQRYLEYAIDIEPPPNLFFEQKAIIALLWDERYRDYFSREERSVFPETYIVTKGAIIECDGARYTLDDIISMPRRSRRFIIKYAGLDLRMNYGGKQVYRLSNISHKKVSKIIDYAVRSYEKRREPWIIQKDISCKSKVDFFDIETLKLCSSEMYQLYRPYYFVKPEDNNVEFVDALMFYRPFFKVHAVRDSVCGLISLKSYV